ncbi:MAG: phosphoribosylglycinamide formyltransferase [Candidatus Muiribacteriaceae bacterium]
MSKKAVILVSGRGSNMSAIIEAVRERRLDLDIVCVMSDRKRPTAFEKAEKEGVDTKFLSGKIRSLQNRLDDYITENNIDYIILAGFMRILTPDFTEKYHRKIINIHPALLPSFPGLDAQRQAWEYGVMYTGVTVHYVDSGVDTGEIIHQNIFRIDREHGFENFCAQLLELEHRTYIEGLKKVLDIDNDK